MYALDENAYHVGAHPQDIVVIYLFYIDGVRLLYDCTAYSLFIQQRPVAVHTDAAHSAHCLIIFINGGITSDITLIYLSH
jgi:hypothetical protein